MNIFSIRMQNIWHIVILKLFICLKFKFNCVSCIFVCYSWQPYFESTYAGNSRNYLCSIECCLANHTETHLLIILPYILGLIYHTLPVFLYDKRAAQFPLLVMGLLSCITNTGQQIFAKFDGPIIIWSLIYTVLSGFHPIFIATLPKYHGDYTSTTQRATFRLSPWA